MISFNSDFLLFFSGVTGAAFGLAFIPWLIGYAIRAAIRTLAHAGRAKEV